MFHTLCLQQHICNTGSDIICLINVSKRLSLNLDEISIKIQISCSNQLHLTCRFKGPWSLLPFFLALIKIILVTSVYTAPILFQKQHLYSATQITM